MKFRFFPILLSASLFLSTACDSDNDSDAGTCDASTFATTCSSDGSKVISCKNDRIFNTICSENTKCDNTKHVCVPNDPVYTQCDAGWQDCDGTTKRLYCENGIKKTESCPSDMTCSNGNCISTSHNNNACKDTDPAVCIDAMTRKYCKDGNYITENAKNSSAQCDPKTGTFKAPSIGGYCDSNIFTEYCYDNKGESSVIWCDNNTVQKTSCDDYGDDYKCDLFANYYKPNKDAAGCFPTKSDCNTPGEIITECKDEADFDDSLPKDTFYATTYYECVQGFSALHLTEIKTVPCQNHCKTASECYEEVESE
jgi:hypothetical protein